MEEINLFLNNNSYKYECENLIRLFFKDCKMNFFFDTAPFGESFFLISVSESREKGEISYKLGGADFKKEISLAGEENEEWALLSALYDSLSSGYGKEPWGMLTGVRPIKLIREMDEKGKTKAQIEKTFKEKFRVSDKKTTLALKTFYNQKDILKDTSPLSVGLYVSIPFCPSRCSYCSFVSGEIERWGELTSQYTELLIEEIEATVRLIKEKSLKIETVYIGGGTPTSLNENELNVLLSGIEKNVDISSLKEFCVEAGRPDTINKEKLSLLKEAGVSRISINPQTLNDPVLRKIGRKHTVEDFYKSFYLAREMGFANINTDLIAGLEGDSVESFKCSLKGIVELSPENITVHTLTLKRAAELYGKNEMYAYRDAVYDMVEHSIEKLQENGYLPYYMYRQKNTIGSLENTGFSKKGKEGLYNIFIMDDSQSIFACGAGGATKTVCDSKVERSFNYKLPLEYIKNFPEALRRKEEAFKIFP